MIHKTSDLCKKCDRIEKEILAVLEKWSNSQEILSRNGGMTKGEIMTAKAVVTGLASEIKRIIGT